MRTATDWILQKSIWISYQYRIFCADNQNFRKDFRHFLAKILFETDAVGVEQDTVMAGWVQMFVDTVEDVPRSYFVAAEFSRLP